MIFRRYREPVMEEEEEAKEWFGITPLAVAETEGEVNILAMLKQAA